MAQYEGVYARWVDNSSRDFREAWAADDEQLKELLTDADTHPDQLVGQLVRYQIADGYAIYIVTKLRPLTLAHIPIGDAWHIPEAHMRGLRTKDVQDDADHWRALRKLFSAR